MRLATFALVTSVSGALLVGCGSDEAAEPEPHAAVADVVFPDLATDEALLRLLAATPRDEAARRLSFDPPLDVDGAVLSVDPPVSFAWALPSAARNAPHPVTPGRPAGPGLRHVWRELVRFLHPVGTAHAHGVPFNGTGFFLTFSAAGSAKPALRVFTAGREYTPEPAQWATLAASDAVWTLAVTYADFENNELVVGGGPFAGGEVSFSVE